MTTATRVAMQFPNEACLILKGGSLPPDGLFLLFKTDEETDLNEGMMRLSQYWQRAVREVMHWLRRLSPETSVFEIRTDRTPNTWELSFSLSYIAGSNPPTVTDEHIRQFVQMLESHLDETITLV